MCTRATREAHMQVGGKAAATRDTRRETTSAGKGNKQEGQRHTNLKGKQRGSSTQQYACDPSGKHVTPRITRSSQVHTQY